MPPGSNDLLRYRLAGASAALILGVAHGLHDLMYGGSWLRAFLPPVPISLQVALLSFGQDLARRRRWSRPKILAAAILLSIACGFAAVSVHESTPLHSGLAIALAGAGALFWFLVFYLPGQLLEARTQALTAESERRRAELVRLRANLHPHFLLNTLNAVAGLLMVEPRQARQLVVALGDLLRDSLEDDGAMRYLEQEAEWLRRYAEIFEIRHRGAIHFKWDLAPETLETPLPRLLLQPLLENAIEHGALQRPNGGTVTLRSRTAGDAIQIMVGDDGPGMSEDRSPGLGLRLVEDRLHVAYPRAKMAIDTSDAGTYVTLELPKVEQAL